MTIGVLVALGSAPYESAALAAVGAGRTHVVRRCVDIADLLATAASGQGQVALVSTHLAGLDRQAVDAIVSAGVAVVGAVEHATDPAAESMRRIGIGSIAALDADADSVESSIAAAAVPRGAAGAAGAGAAGGVERGHVPRHDHPANDAPPRDEPGGRVVAVWGPTGAPGRSVVALGLGAAIADLGGDALVVDADVYGGTIGQLAGILDETSGLLSATRAANAGGLDAAALGRRTLLVSPRLRVLTGLPRADRWVEAKTVLVRAVLDAARRLATHTVVDCGFSLEVDEEVVYDTRAPRRNGATLEILTRADVVLVVGTADPVGLSRLIRALGDLAEAVPRAQPIVVVNRLRDGIGWSADDIESLIRRTTGRTEIRFLPDDPTGCDRSLVAGKTLLEVAPDRQLARRVRELAAEIGELPNPAGRRWSGRWARQGKKRSQRPVKV
jgi:MinD-like ATPase involved in chromosome partitioning or flagellar assembly